MQLGYYFSFDHYFNCYIMFCKWFKLNFNYPFLHNILYWKYDSSCSIKNIFTLFDNVGNSYYFFCSLIWEPIMSNMEMSYIPSLCLCFYISIRISNNNELLVSFKFQLHVILQQGELMLNHIHWLLYVKRCLGTYIKNEIAKLI